MIDNRAVSSQIPLQFGFHSDYTFANFFTGDNELYLDVLKKISVGELNHQVFLWGSAATGKTHLLNAICQSTDYHGGKAAYIPLLECETLKPDILHDLASIRVVCIDDIQAVKGSLDWQQSLTWLYNEMRDQNHSLIISANQAVNKLELELSDLSTRLNWDQLFQLKTPDDDIKRKILHATAKRRAFVLPEEVVEYLINHVDRNLHSLMRLLDVIDQASLAEQRKVTIPFVKTLLN